MQSACHLETYRERTVTKIDLKETQKNKYHMLELKNLRLYWKDIFSSVFLSFELVKLYQIKGGVSPHYSQKKDLMEMKMRKISANTLSSLLRSSSIKYDISLICQLHAFSTVLDSYEGFISRMGSGCCVFNNLLYACFFCICSKYLCKPNFTEILAI